MANKRHMHRAIPVHAQKLRDAASILAVCLHGHRRQRGLHKARFQQHHVKAS